FKCIARDVTARAAARPYERSEVMFVRHVSEKTGHGECTAGKIGQYIFAAGERRTVTDCDEICEICVYRNETICFVVKTADGDTCHAHCSLEICVTTCTVMSVKRAACSVQRAAIPALCERCA